MFVKVRFHYIDVIMTTMASQITSLTVVYSTVYSDTDQRKHQSSASLAFVWGIHRDRWIPCTKGQLRGKCFHLMMSSCADFAMICLNQVSIGLILWVSGQYWSGYNVISTCYWRYWCLLQRSCAVVWFYMTMLYQCVIDVYTKLYAKGEIIHDDIIKWKHFPHNWPFVRGIHRSPVNSPHKGQWRGALMFSLICVWINDWVNNREGGDLRRYRAHYDVIVMEAYWCSMAALWSPLNQVMAWCRAWTSALMYHQLDC